VLKVVLAAPAEVLVVEVQLEVQVVLDQEQI
jgi:hypothetical protein